jgi:hypothetical protein
LKDLPPEQAIPRRVTPYMDRRNGNIFLAAQLLLFLAAPITYPGIVQAALCNKLGAGATLANLPGAAYMFGTVAPIFFAWAIPHRLELPTLVWSWLVAAALTGVAGVTLLLPLAKGITISAVIAQGLVQGLAASVAQVFMYQCLGRGTTLAGRARALGRVFTAAPICAVAGSLGTQFVLSGGIGALPYPYDFAAIYLLSAPCCGLAAWLWRRYDPLPVKDEPRGTLASYLSHSVRAFVSSRALVYLWIGYALWYCTIAGMPNLALYSKQAVGVDPARVSGAMMAVRFGLKAMAGWLLGRVALRYGMRAPLLATVALAGGGMLWAWLVPGYANLLSVGFMGAGELGGAYFPNYMVSISSSEEGARSLSILTLATLAAGVAATVHGALTDIYGFHASFFFGIATAVAGWLVVTALPAVRCAAPKAPPRSPDEASPADGSPPPQTAGNPG